MGQGRFEIGFLRVNAIQRWWIKAKILLRELHEKECKLEWDDPLPAVIVLKWVSFIREASQMITLKVPRGIRAFPQASVW